MGGGRGGPKRGRTQRRHFRQNRDNVWRKKNRTDAPPSSDNNTTWEPFVTQNPSFEEYYKVFLIFASLINSGLFCCLRFFFASLMKRPSFLIRNKGSSRRTSGTSSSQFSGRHCLPPSVSIPGADSGPSVNRFFPAYLLASRQQMEMQLFFVGAGS